jgi:hypothetical protein
MHFTLVCPHCLSAQDVYRSKSGAANEPEVAHCYGCSHDWRSCLPGTGQEPQRNPAQERRSLRRNRR